MFHSRVSSVATAPPEITTNSGIVERSYDNGVAFILALSSTEVFTLSFPAFTHICTYIIYKGFDLDLICISVNPKASRS